MAVLRMLSPCWDWVGDFSSVRFESDAGAGLDVYAGNFDSSQLCQMKFGGVTRTAKSTKWKRSVVLSVKGVYISH